MFAGWQEGTATGAVRQHAALLLLVFSMVLSLGLLGPPTPSQAKTYILPGKGVTPPLDKPPPQLKQALRDARVIHRESGALSKPWGVNETMSRACSRGSFKQRADRRLIAIFDRRVYGAAVGGHSSLVDRAGLSKAQVIYLFDRQGTTDCRVFHRGQ